jgi:hypothetical protein
MKKDRYVINDGPRRLTPKELDDLREDMKEASAWARAELRRRRVSTMSGNHENSGVFAGKGISGSR